MDVIPVIDVRHGATVHARRGERSEYRPLQTPLAQGSDPISVARAYLALHPFRTLYMADLDGIEGHGANPALVAQLAQELPGLLIWLDDGSLGERPPNAWTVPVVGSESLTKIDDLARVGDRSAQDFVLSLDFRGDRFLGPWEIIENADLWPRRVIVMTLARVGAAGGPDLVRVSEIAARAAGRSIYAAGGVRNRADLEALRDAGAAGALVATALHAGTITAGDLDEIAGR
jgi:HisA/HisF family protein